MSAAHRSPLDGAARLIVDGTNLLHRLGAGRGAVPPAAIVGRLRATIPPAVTIELVFDGIGHGVTGRVAQQMFVRHSGRHTGDELIMELAGLDDATVLVVTDDRALRETLMARGIKTAPLLWILGRLSLPALASAAPGNRRAPIGSRQPAAGPSGGGGGHSGGSTGDDDGDRPGWNPGRGATTKTGPMHKVARHKRHPKNS